MRKWSRLGALVIICLFALSTIAAAALPSQTPILQKPGNYELAKAAIKITAPHKDQVFDLRWGYTKKIEWSYSGFLHGKTLDNTNVKINLYKAGNFVKTIADSTTIGANGSGSYSWTVTPDIIWGKEYQIEIISLADQNIKVMSEKFSILYIVT